VSRISLQNSQLDVKGETNDEGQSGRLAPGPKNCCRARASPIIARRSSRGARESVASFSASVEGASAKVAPAPMTQYFDLFGQIRDAVLVADATNRVGAGPPPPT
jgi:hypothetical protein